MESRKNFVIIDIDSERSQKTLDKLKKANVKVRLAKTKPEIDDIFRTGGIEAMLIAPQVAGDIKRLKEFYKAPIFIVGEVELTNLPKLYAEDVVDIFPSDFNVGLLFQKLGLDYIEPFNPPSKPQKRVNSVFDNEEEPFDNLGDKVPITGFKSKENNKPMNNPVARDDEKGFRPRQLPVINNNDDVNYDDENGEEYEAVSGFKTRKSKSQRKQPPQKQQKEKKGGFFARLNQPIGKKR